MPVVENCLRDRKSIEITVVTVERDLRTGTQAAAVYKISHKIARFLHSLGACLKRTRTRKIENIVISD
ncbi:MAG: hypothetical protein AUH86_06425 [Acidobacteria bacterium 13_1_40CM_4_58_4]|nr:MAG: hypothetical protein AUH86_06425 [Acidobacteria bacterium 13_1_40CM_4_58_4]